MGMVTNHPHAAVAGDVFSRAEYRDPTKIIKEIVPAWNALNMALCAESTNPDDQRVVGIRKNVAGGEGLQIKPFDSVMNEFQCEVAAMHLDPNQGNRRLRF
jgi:hypothetical protein